MILGIDEVGRGPWAGPLVMGACILNDAPREEWQELLTDSKKLTAKKRGELEPIILSGVAACGLGWVSAEELDDIGMSKALRLACRRAVEEVRKVGVPFSEIIIDGTVNFLSGTSLGPYVTNLKKADSLIKEVSAASIIAKVARDRYMVEVAERYPGYGFERHVGYGTKLHREMLEKYGACPEHRKSFKPVAEIAKSHLVSPGLHSPTIVGVAPLCLGRDPHNDPRDTDLATSRPSSTEVGRRAEGVVVNYLASLKHTIAGRNYRTKWYEIDVISVKNGVIYFTEVKYRRDRKHGSPLEMVGKEKLRQMKFAAEAFMNQNKLSYKPKLAVAAVVGPNYKLEKWFSLEAE